MTHPRRGFQRSLHGAEGGFSLIVALMMLIVIVILGVSSSQMAINEERGARNDRDRQVAFQAAEAALKDAEYEILNPLSPACTDGNLAARGRPGAICFDSHSQTGFQAGGCSAPPNSIGLCAYNLSPPAYLSPTVDFYADARGTGNNNTVPYGYYTHRVFPSQATLPGMPAYPPRYIIERVPKNLSIDATGRWMFRITAMGFGANANSQVVLQSIVNVNLD